LAETSKSGLLDPLHFALESTHTAPELLYLETKWASLVAYDVTVNLLKDVLPIGDKTNAETVRNHLHKMAAWAEAELGEERACFIDGCPATWKTLPHPEGPIVVGIDGGFVRSSEDKKNHFQVIVGKSVPEDRADRCFGFVQCFDPKPKRRLFEVLRSQGLQSNQEITFLTDGGDDVRGLARHMSPCADHILDCWGGRPLFPTSRCPNLGAARRYTERNSSMKEISTIGLDLAKNVFQIHGLDAEGHVLVRRQLRRGEVIGFFAGLKPCLVGMEACATAHFWARELAKLGHEVRLMPPAYVKPYVKRGKTDAADAAAIAEAVMRPTMRFVAVKSAGQQSVLMLHKVRDLLVRQRTALINALRGHLGEFGIIAPQGARKVPALIEALQTAGEEVIPELARDALQMLVGQLRFVETRIAKAEAAILAWHRSSQASRRLATIPGVGPITASAIAATVPDARLFESGRQFAAWLGLTPQPRSSGGKQRLGRISRQGNSYVRRLLVTGMTAVIRYARTRAGGNSWVAQLLERKPTRLVSVALANKTARVAWAMLARNQSYVAAAPST
jgi:transposase